MLSNLFISKVRVKMLNQFLFNIDEEYHVRGLVRALDEEINAVRRELQNLEDAGLLKSQRKGNKLFYRVDKNYILINELRSLLYKNRDDIIKIFNNLLKVDGIETALITENYLDESYESDHDIDLLILGDVDVLKLQDVLKKIEVEIGRELRTTVMKPDDIEFHHKKRDEFLLNILRKDRIMLIGHEMDLI